MDVLLAVLPELKMGDTIQAYILRKRRPAFLDVVNANTGARGAGGSAGRWPGSASGCWASSASGATSSTSAWGYGCGGS